MDLAVFDAVGDEAEQGADPEHQREAAEEVLGEFDPFGRRFGRRQRVRPVALQIGRRLLRRQSLANLTSSANISFSSQIKDQFHELDGTISRMDKNRVIQPRFLFKPGPHSFH